MDARIPLSIVATDLRLGEKVVLSSGAIRQALRASVAIPLVFAPWEVDGRLLIDGAASDPLPIDVAIQAGAPVIIAMGFMLEYRARLRSVLAVQSQLSNIYSNNLLKATYAFHNLAHHAEIFPVLPEFDRPLSMFDAPHIPYIIEQGERAAEAQWPHWQRAVEALESAAGSRVPSAGG